MICTIMLHEEKQKRETVRHTCDYCDGDFGDLDIVHVRAETSGNLIFDRSTVCGHQHRWSIVVIVHDQGVLWRMSNLRSWVGEGHVIFKA